MPWAIKMTDAKVHVYPRKRDGWFILDYLNEVPKVFGKTDPAYSPLEEKIFSKISDSFNKHK